MMKVSSVDFAPLMKGKVQLSKVSNVKRELKLKELHSRGADVDPKEADDED